MNHLTDEQVQSQYEEFVDWFHWKYQHVDEYLYLILECPCFETWLASKDYSATDTQIKHVLSRDKGE
jgi:hypothetical protein